MLAVAERQSLETLRRDFKTSTRALEQLKDKVEQLTSRKAKLGEDETTQRARRSEVRASGRSDPPPHILSNILSV